MLHEESFSLSDYRTGGEIKHTSMCSRCFLAQRVKTPPDIILTSSSITQGSMPVALYDVTRDVVYSDDRGVKDVFIRLSDVEADGPHSVPLPRHPDYGDFNKRLLSFATWRYSRVQDPVRLANQGFFFTGEGDLVRCFYCSIGLKDFIASDDTLLEHVRFSGDCPFLLELMDTEWLNILKENIRAERLGQLPLPHSAEASGTPGHTHGKSAGQPASPGLTRYRHPEYRLLSVRVSSFNDWPRNLVQTPQRVAEAGFYFTGVRDVVRCWACDGGLESWDPTDDPWIEHCRWFPFCPFARETKGDAYIAQVKSYYEGRSNQQKVSAPSQEQATNAQPVDQLVKPMTVLAVSEMSNAVNNANGTRIPNVETVKDRQTWRSDVAESVLDMGFKENDVRRAVTELKTEHIEETVERIIDKIETITKKAKKTEPSPSAELKAEDVIAENIRLKSMVVCNGCHKEDNNALFLPCQHHRYCVNCAGHMTHCPVCGQKIVQVVKTYLS